jgi:glycine/D-amino acid oxidase-like deaminating enzyme/nitrite reductase/ring-hydroxylating ferredoxin subunit
MNASTKEKTVSLWEGTAKKGSAFPPLNEDKEADVVIIGGGITGLTTAMRLSEAGKKVVLLEAWQIGLGTTGNSTGNLYITVDEHLSVIKNKWGKDVMQAVAHSRAEAVNFIEATINKHNIDCDFYRTSFNLFLEDRNEAVESFFEEELEALTEVGAEANIVGNPGLPFEVTHSLTLEGQAQFHPLKYVRALAELLKNTCEIHEHSQVIDFDEDLGIVKTSHGSVKAPHVIMATHTPKGVYRVHTVLGPYREHGMAAELLSDQMPRGIFWSMNKPKHSIRCFKNGNKNYVMAIGEKYKTGHGDDTSKYVEELKDYLKARFDIGPITHVWAGQQYRPADSLPYIGKQGDFMYLLTGYASDGLTYGTLAAMIVSDMILGKANPWQDVYNLNRITPIKSFKEFFKENIDNLVQLVTGPSETEDAKFMPAIPPGEGRIIEKDGEKLAVYKDEDGVNHVCSAVCTHLKCTVNWNPVEKSWDCPCHGSRFKTDGQVIEGPAVVGLPLCRY